MRRFAIAIALALGACCGPADDAPDAGAGEGDAAVGSCLDAPASKTGEATYYAANGTGNCSFDASPDDLMVAAMNAVDYATAAWCGACLEVTGSMGSVVVRVVDQCPGCQEGDVDLSREAFAMISPLAAGRVPISWRSVACDVTGPVAYHFKDGANAFWTAIQVRNHRYPIARLEAQGTGGAWTEIARLSYNYFVEPAGLGAGPYTLRVTDTRGQVIEDTGIALGDDVTRSGAQQFPRCP